ncbi:hypothetical protein ZIOFF_070743 [Zingiber officinale]|uniref:RING-type E3 ubiquitin transferase n=2 Tax=Zingiber officinale TaxID=94328 RepID=A0A8J5C8R5_ZINOF|nr:hypothetical protein ZIOFF_070743 [Zingiber officinale]
MWPIGPMWRLDIFYGVGGGSVVLRKWWTPRGQLLVAWMTELLSCSMRFVVPGYTLVQLGRVARENLIALMQGERSTFQPFCDVLEIDQPSSSSTSVMDQQMLWNDLPLSVENQDLRHNPLSSRETILCREVASQENSSLDFWDQVGPCSTMPSLNQGSPSEIIPESDWMPSAPGRTGEPRIVDSRCEAMDTLSFETDNADLNINLGNNRQPSFQFLDVNEPPTENVEMSSQFLDMQLHSGSSNEGSSPCQHIPISSSSRAIDFFSKNDGGKQKIAECSSHKRKNVKQDDAECSASVHSTIFGEGSNCAGEEINVRISTLRRGATSDRHHYVSASGNSESFRQNNRMKISHANETNDFTPGLCLLGNGITSYNPWPAQPSSATAPSNQSYDSSYLGSNLGARKQHNLCTPPVVSLDLYPFPQSGISTTEVGSSSGSPAIAVDGSVVEPDQLHAPINISEQVSVSPISTMNMIPDQTNWHSASGTTVLSGNSVPTSQVGTNLGVHQSSGANWLTHQNRRRISEAVRRNFLSSGSECRGQTISLPPHQNNSSTPQEVGRRQSGAVSRALQHPYLRLNMLHRQNSGALGIPLPARTPAAARERRNRMSEIRNVFDLIRRGDNLLLQDVLLLEQSAFVGGANLLDRYRDMRLDVDNMSYEELLQLGERIGSVNTGLSEEKILECLQQHKHVALAAEASEEVEPCCICREEYVEGEELGRLDCSHDFHSSCIKKWLVIKNLCPICKTTALSTRKEDEIH